MSGYLIVRLSGRRELPVFFYQARFYLFPPVFRTVGLLRYIFGSPFRDLDIAGLFSDLDPSDTFPAYA